jgi:hypothetical protein
MPIYSIVNILEHDEKGVMIDHCVIYGPDLDTVLHETRLSLDKLVNSGWEITDRLEPLQIDNEMIQAAMTELDGRNE